MEHRCPRSVHRPDTRPGRWQGRRLERWSVAGLVALAVLGWAARPAAATWSIVAADPETGLVGAAMASCVPAGVLGDPDRTLVPVVLVPGRGAAVAQGTIDPAAPDRIRRFLADGATPDEVLRLLSESDDLVLARQYAIVITDTDETDTDDPGAVPHTTFTGAQVEPASNAGGRAEPDRVASIGGLLADPAVVDRVLEGFVESRDAGRSLDRALADALLAGSEAGGDSRCGDQTALFAHLAVAEADDDGERPSLLLTVTVDEGDGQNPVRLLDAALDDGRTGWVDAGLEDPVGIPRLLVGAIGVALTVAAVLVVRRGMGHPVARRSTPR